MKESTTRGQLMFIKYMAYRGVRLRAMCRHWPPSSTRKPESIHRKTNAFSSRTSSWLRSSISYVPRNKSLKLESVRFTPISNRQAACEELTLTPTSIVMVLTRQPVSKALTRNVCAFRVPSTLVVEKSMQPSKRKRIWWKKKGGTRLNLMISNLEMMSCVKCLSWNVINS